MAAESELIRLLFSMSGVRSIYSTFLQGPRQVQSSAQLAAGISELFPTAQSADVARLSRELWAAKIGGENLTDRIEQLRLSAGDSWPQSAVSGNLPGVTEQAPISWYGGIPTITIPGVGSARYIVQGLVTATSVNPDGTLEIKTVQIVAPFDHFPTYQEIVQAFVANAEGGGGDLPRGLQIYVDPATGGSDVTITIMTLITTVP